MLRKIQETDKQSKNPISSIDEPFEVLEDVTNMQISKISTHLADTNPTNASRHSVKSQNKQEILSESSVRRKSIHLTDQFQQTVNMCSNCTKCSELEQKLKKVLAEKEIAEYSLMQTTILLQELKKEHKLQKQETVKKTQLNYCMESLKQMLKSYEDENDRLQRFIFQTINSTPKPSSKKKSTAQIIEGVVTDLMFSWQEILKQLNYLAVISSSEFYARAPRENNLKYDHFSAMNKLEQIKQNILELQKKIRAK